MINDRVLMKVSDAIWHLNHQDVYCISISGKLSYNNYDNEVQLHLMCAMGVPVYGRVIGIGSMRDTWLVEYKVGNIRTDYYTERRNFSLV